MGISSKWIKSLVGIRKQEKGQNAEKQEKGRNAESSETVSHGIPPRFILLCRFRIQRCGRPHQ